MRAIWYGEAPVAFDGPHTSFSGIDAHPRPTRTIPVVVGGRTPGAHRRAIEQGDGWYGFHLSAEAAAEQVELLRDAATRYDRPAALGELEISVTPDARLTRESVAAYAGAGVHRLIVRPGERGDASAERFLGEQAELVLG
jgi:alkanesulfonate monooxygenase SsuD/methylene tetrahydromethanopterin reductase-like flavin-dependent oxidoreductase (luciferase family)